MFRLVRGTGYILDVLDVLHRDRLALRVQDGSPPWTSPPATRAPANRCPP
ncbi:hypothetical protein ACWCP3_01705 [Streptomyces eurythermus]